MKLNLYCLNILYLTSSLDNLNNNHLKICMMLLLPVIRQNTGIEIGVTISMF